MLWLAAHPLGIGCCSHRRCRRVVPPAARHRAVRSLFVDRPLRAGLVPLGQKARHRDRADRNSRPLFRITCRRMGTTGGEAREAVDLVPSSSPRLRLAQVHHAHARIVCSNADPEDERRRNRHYSRDPSGHYPGARTLARHPNDEATEHDDRPTGPSPTPTAAALDRPAAAPQSAMLAEGGGLAGLRGAPPCATTDTRRLWLVVRARHPRQSRRPALAGIIGGVRRWIVLMISALSMPCR